MTPPREAGGNIGDEAQPAASSEETWELHLYVTGRTPTCIRAIANLQYACAHWLPGRYQIEVIDLLENPRLAAGNQILAAPTLVRKHPLPIRKIVGDLSDTEAVAEAVYSSAYAFWSAAMSNFVIASIASVTRLAFPGSGSLIMSMSMVGTTCQDSPYLSVSQPQAIS